MPPVRITIEVDDKGSAKITSATNALKGLEQQTLKVGQASTQATAGTTNLTNGLSGMARSVVGIAAVTTGIGTLGAALAAAGQSVSGFDNAMATVNTLIAGNIPLQQQLRAEILKLPPALGDSADLAKGLYAALSAGIEPAKAVQFVADSALAAKAGLTELAPTTDTIAKALQFFGKEVQTVTQVSDLMFQTVNVGFGTFDQFGKAFASVNPTAAQLGISLKEVSAVLATLSATFESPTQAATGLQGIMNNLIQNNEKFAALGIDVQQVIGESGLTGVLRRMAEATGGNSTQIQKLIGDQQGMIAALSLTGKQAETLTKNMRVMGDATGSTLKASEERMKALSEQWNTFTATLGRFVQENSVAVVGAMGSMLNAATRLIETIRGNNPFNWDINLGFKIGGKDADPVTLGSAFSAMFEQIGRGVDFSTEGISRLAEAFGKVAEQFDAARTYGKTLDELKNSTTGWRDETSRAVDALAAGNTAVAQWRDESSRAAVSTAAAATATREWRDETVRTVEGAKGLATYTQYMNQLRDAAKGLGVSLRDDVQKGTDTALENLQKLFQSGQVHIQSLAEEWPKLRKQAEDSMGQLPPAWRDMENKILQEAKKLGPGIYEPLRDGIQKSKDAMQGLGDAASKVGVTLKSEMQSSAKEAFSALQSLVSRGEISINKLVEIWPEFRKKALDAFGELPPGWQKMENELLGYARQTGVGVYEELKKGIDASNKAFSGLADSAADAFQRLSDALKKEVAEIENATSDMYGNVRRAGKTDSQGHIIRDDSSSGSDSGDSSSDDSSSFAVSGDSERVSKSSGVGRRRNQRVTGTRSGNTVTSDSGQRYYTDSSGRVVSQEVNTRGGQSQEGTSRSYDTSSAESIRNEIRKFQEAIRGLQDTTSADYTGYTRRGEYERWQINEYRKAISSLNKELESYYEDHPEERRVQEGGGLYTGAEYDAKQEREAKQRERNQERAKKISEANTRTSSQTDYTMTESERWQRRRAGLDDESAYDSSDDSSATYYSYTSDWGGGKITQRGSTSKTGGSRNRTSEWESARSNNLRDQGNGSYTSWSRQRKKAGQSYSYDDYLKDTGKTEEYVTTDASGNTYVFNFTMSGSLDGEAAWENLYKRIRDAQRQGKLVS